MYSAPAGWLRDLKVHNVWMKNNFIYFFPSAVPRSSLFRECKGLQHFDNILPVICFYTFKDTGLQSWFFFPANTYVYSQMAQWQWCNAQPIFKSCHWSVPPSRKYWKITLACAAEWTTFDFFMALLLVEGCLMLKLTSLKTRYCF